MKPGPKPKTLEQVWERLLKEATYLEDCILVEKGFPIGLGYRMCWIKREGWYVHHLADFVANGPAPSGTVRRHTCDKPNCINTKHIIRGTHKENVDDKVSKKRHTFGVNHPSCVALNDAAVREIRKSDKTHAELGREYGISRGGIHNIRTRRTWKHVE